MFFHANLADQSTEDDDDQPPVPTEPSTAPVPPPEPPSVPPTVPVRDMDRSTKWRATFAVKLYRAMKAENIGQVGRKERWRGKVV